MARTHGHVPGGAAAVVAMGKLGGREMTAASDLDLILIYDFDPKAAYSNGLKPLPVTQYYTRLTQRLISAFTAPTAEGILYEVDMRLRPSGQKGPVATQLSSRRLSEQERLDLGALGIDARARRIRATQARRRRREGDP
jgi:glutamate-ammonia-ligase adenylyltransferase